MTRLQVLSAVSMTLLAAVVALPAQAQCNLAGSPETGLRIPLVNGAPRNLPGTAVQGAPPETVGDGPVPAPVNPGNMGCPTLIPSNLQAPGNHVGGGSSYYLPYSEATQARPGQLGPSLYAPPPPSTPGCDPGYMPGPQEWYRPPVTVTPINPGGGIYAYAPTQKWGGQTSTDYGRYKYRGTQKYDFGQGMWYGQTSQDGPQQQLPYSVPTQDLYGRRGYTNNGGTTQTYAPY